MKDTSHKDLESFLVNNSNNIGSVKDPDIRLGEHYRRTGVPSELELSVNIPDEAKMRKAFADYKNSFNRIDFLKEYDIPYVITVSKVFFLGFSYGLVIATCDLGRINKIMRKLHKFEFFTQSPLYEVKPTRNREAVTSYVQHADMNETEIESFRADQNISYHNVHHTVEGNVYQPIHNSSFTDYLKKSH